MINNNYLWPMMSPVLHLHCTVGSTTGCIVYMDLEVLIFQQDINEYSDLFYLWNEAGIVSAWTLISQASKCVCCVLQQQHHSHTRPFNGPFFRTSQVSRYQKGKINRDFSEPRDSEWQWHQLGHMQVCTSLQTENRASTSPLSCLLAWCPSCCPTNSIKALKVYITSIY